MSEAGTKVCEYGPPRGPSGDACTPRVGLRRRGSEARLDVTVARLARRRGLRRWTHSQFLDLAGLAQVVHSSGVAWLDHRSGENRFQLVRYCQLSAALSLSPYDVVDAVRL